MAFPVTANVKFRTFKSTGVDTGDVVVLREQKASFDRADHKVIGLVDREATVTDLKAGNEGKIINGVPVVRKDGYAPYFGQIKRNYPLWKHGVGSPEWEFVKNYGEYYLESKPE